jgi:hypothetical protein
MCALQCCVAEVHGNSTFEMVRMCGVQVSVGAVSRKPCVVRVHKYHRQQCGGVHLSEGFLPISAHVWWAKAVMSQCPAHLFIGIYIFISFLGFDALQCTRFVLTAEQWHVI